MTGGTTKPGQSIREYARRTGTSANTAWARIRRDPSLAIRVDGSSGSNGFSFRIVDIPRMDAAMAGVRRPKKRRPAGPPPSGEAGSASA